jgi:hypothetical protein
MRENRSYGSEGGEGLHPSRPYQGNTSAARGRRMQNYPIVAAAGLQSRRPNAPDQRPGAIGQCAQNIQPIPTVNAHGS